MGLRSMLRKDSALRKRIVPKKGEVPAIKRIISAGVPFVPSLIIQTGEHRIVGYKKKIFKPKNFDGLLKKGDNVLYWHLESTDPETITKLVRKLTSPETKELLSRAGYSGVLGDVPNPDLRKLYEKRGFVKISAPIPKVTQVREKIRYAGNVLKRGYPKETLKNPFERVLLKL